MLTKEQMEAQAALKTLEAKELARRGNEITQHDNAEQNQHTLLDSFTRTNGNGTILLEHGPIAAYLHELYHTISFNKMLFIYDQETGIYRETPGIWKKKSGTL